MRAVFLKEFFPTNVGHLELDGDFSHHLINVLRIKNHDDLLLLNGAGKIATSTVKEVKKKSVIVDVLSLEMIEPKHLNSQILLGAPKKEALSDMLKISVELGISKIFIYRSEYSTEMNLSKERMEKLMISALEQSNNPFIPKLEIITSLDGFFTDDKKFMVFHLLDKIHQKKFNIDENLQNCILCIGPEAGWSIKELNWFCSKGASIISLDTSIMRAPTALATCYGWYLKLMET